MDIPNRAYAVGQEFTNYILIDRTRKSIILNVDVEHFKTIYREYKRLNYKLVCCCRFKDNNTLTCVFIIANNDK